MKCLVAVVGPTAVGKSLRAVSIAKKYNGEIINADSRQIYRYMDIGTAKPGKAERSAIPHHLLDIVDPDESYSVALYQRAAADKIAKLQALDRMPLLVGGSGQYIWSVLEGWKIPSVEPDPSFRKTLENRAEREGAQSLYRDLERIDEAAAQKISPNNVRRVIRALEIYQQTGIKSSELQVKAGVSYPVLVIGLTAGRDKLYALIDKRTERMVESRFMEEVEGLIKMGYSPDLPSMSSLGYRQISMFLKGELALEEAVQKIKYETHRFARSQYAWFRLRDARIKWFDIGNDMDDEIDYTIETFLANVKQL
jgi:tRNA dimethylallyltransferase